MIGHDTESVLLAQLSIRLDKAVSIVRKPSMRSRMRTSFLRAISFASRQCCPSSRLNNSETSSSEKTDFLALLNEPHSLHVVFGVMSDALERLYGLY